MRHSESSMTCTWDCGGGRSKWVPCDELYTFLIPPKATLKACKPGASIIPVIISSDHTQVTLFWNRTAYLIYMTIGNLPKAIRCEPLQQGQILLAYLLTSKLKFITNKSACQHMLSHQYISCMPLVSYITAYRTWCGGDAYGQQDGNYVTGSSHTCCLCWGLSWAGSVSKLGYMTGRNQSITDLDCSHAIVMVADHFYNALVYGDRVTV